MNIIPAYYALAASFKRLIEQRSTDIVVNNLVSTYFANWDFDEEWYFANNPDLAAAIPSDVFPTAYSHFVGIGYVEGRLPVKPVVDNSWYLATYPDVAAAIIKSTFDNASHHYLQNGYKEGRLPSAPEIDVSWYGKAYLAGSATEADCEQHFVAVGYLNGALPQQRQS